jgi:hypothetical protein
MTTQEQDKLRELIKEELAGVGHICHQVDKINAQDEKIQEVHKVVTGNGSFEDGLTYKLGVINERQQSVLKALAEINNRRKATPGNIIKWSGLMIAFGGMIIGFMTLNAGQKEIQTDQKVIQAETKVTNKLLAPDSTQATVSIRGNVYIPVLKTDSANIIRSNKLDAMYDSLYNGWMKSRK